MDKLTLESLIEHHPRRALVLREEGNGRLLMCPRCTRYVMPCLVGFHESEWDDVDVGAGLTGACFMCDTTLEPE